MKEFYKEAIEEMERYLRSENFYTKKEFGKLTGFEWMSRKSDMVKALKERIMVYEKLLKA